MALRSASIAAAPAAASAPAALMFPGGIRLDLADLTATSAKLTLLSDVQPGDVRIAIVRGDGSLFGWDGLRILAPAAPVSPSPSESASSSGSPTPTASATPAPAGGQATTGVADPSRIAWTGAAVGLIGAGLLIVRRARAGARHP